LAVQYFPSYQQGTVLHDIVQQKFTSFINSLLFWKSYVKS